jgi:hypothetical protein
MGGILQEAVILRARLAEVSLARIRHKLPSKRVWHGPFSLGGKKNFSPGKNDKLWLPDVQGEACPWRSGSSGGKACRLVLHPEDLPATGREGHS